MVDPELLEILVCPETKSPVRLADDALLDRINRAVEDGRLMTREGKQVEGRLEGGLVREDGRVLYPIRDGIPVMLIDEAIPLDSL
jgi:uncharacterized protein